MPLSGLPTRRGRDFSRSAMCSRPSHGVHRARATRAPWRTRATGFRRSRALVRANAGRPDRRPARAAHPKPALRRGGVLSRTPLPASCDREDPTLITMPERETTARTSIHLIIFCPCGLHRSAVDWEGCVPVAPGPGPSLPPLPACPPARLPACLPVGFVFLALQAQGMQGATHASRENPPGRQVCRREQGMTGRDS